MPRYVLDISYKGTRYYGSAVQPEKKTVQGEVQRVLGTILRVEDMFCYLAGRTDRGVHALKMPAHFDYDGDLPRKLLHAANRLLPYDIAVENVRVPHDPEFNARFAAIARTYKYTISKKKRPLISETTTLFTKELDMDSMQAAAKAMFDYNSFESFCKTGGNNKTFFCRIMESKLEDFEDTIVYTVSADRFLRGMVRAIVGTLLEVGKGKMTVDDFRKVIEAKNRSEAGNSVAPEGLALVDVEFPEDSLVPYEGWIDPPHGTPGFDSAP